MIPKVIHYCWFGRNPLPKLALKCIASWRRFFPDYEIKEWNEDNFDVNIIPYTRDAYAAKKYAFVSDYARFWILYHFGGIYFDTDVEVIRPMDDIIERGPFMGIECGIDDGKKLSVAPGLGLSAEVGHPIYKQILDHFFKLAFWLPDGDINSYTMIPLVTESLKEKGLIAREGIQEVCGIYIYPPDYLNPLDDSTGLLNKTKNTRAIHWFMKSWMSPEKRWRASIMRIVRRLLGNELSIKLRGIFRGY